MKKMWISGWVVLSFAGLTLAQNEDVSSLDNPVPPLMRNLNSDYVRVAASAARSLSVIFAPGGRGGDELPEVTKALIGTLSSSKGAILRRESAVGLGRMKARDALEPLKEAIKDVDYTVAVAAANAIREVLPTDEARAYLKEIAKDETESVKVAAYDAMAQIGKSDDADFFIEGMDSKNWRIQTSGIRGLERSVRAGARPEPAIYDKVASHLGSEVANTAEASLWFLAHTRNDESLRATIAAADIVGDGGPDDTSWRTRTYAIRTLHNMGWPTNQKGLSAVIRQLGDPTANVVNEARGFLNYLRKEKLIHHHTLFPYLLTELEAAKTDGLRAGIMGEMQNNVPNQYNSRVAKIAVTCLTDAMENKASWQVRAYAINLLARSENTSAIELIATCVGDDLPNVRQAAGHALSRLGQNCTEDQKNKVAPILQTWLTDTRDWRKTSIAARNAGYYPSNEAIAPLVKLLSHGVVNVKDAASHSLVNLVEHRDTTYRESVHGKVLPELESTDLSWEYGARVLGALQDPKTTPLLLKILTKGNWRAKENAARAVARIAEQHKISDKDLNDALIRNAQSDIQQVQEASNFALRSLAK